MDRDGCRSFGGRGATSLVQQHGHLCHLRHLRIVPVADGDGATGRASSGGGRRTASWDGGGRATWRYDKMGRVTREERYLDGKGYIFESSFDAISRVYRATLPDGEVLTYTYGANGLLVGIASSLGLNYVSSVEYNALNQPKRYTLGSGTTGEMRHSYYGPDAAGYPYGALKTIEMQKGTDPRLVNRQMEYDPAGNVTRIVDGVSSETIDYSYDDLDRLLGASAPVSESYAYDQLGVRFVLLK